MSHRRSVPDAPRTVNPVRTSRTVPVQPRGVTADTRFVSVRRLTAVLAALVLALLAASGSSATLRAVPARAPASEIHVAVSDFLYTPSVVSLARGGTVTFDFAGPSHHTVTDASGMNLYDSGSVGAGGASFAVTVQGAGEYRFTCIPHPWMGGHIAVPMRVQPRRGTHADIYAATWAAVAPDTGFVYDVELRRPGRHWRPWLSDQTSTGVSFGLHAGDGVYRFRARLRSLASGGADWSPVTTVVVR
jgi:plastocyanin